MTPAPAPTPAPAQTPAPKRRALSAALVALSTLIALEYLAVTTAMPVIAADLDGFALYGLAFSGAMAAAVFATVLGGPWGDVRGPAEPTWIGVGTFVAGLVTAGLAPNLAVFLAGRLLQGFGGSLFVVAMYLLVARVYPAELHPKVFSLLATAWVVPSMAGPALIGLVAEHLGWRWVFLGVAVLAVPAMYVLARGLKGQPIAGGQATRVPGLARRLAWAAVAAVGAAAMQLGSGTETGGAALPVLLAGAAALAVALPRLLPERTLRAARGLPAVVLLRGLVAGAFIAAEVLVPLMLVEQHHLSPTLAGVALTGGALSWSAASAVQGRGWVSRPFALTGGAAFVTAGITLMGLVSLGAIPTPVAYASWILAGFGIGMVYPTLSVRTLELSEAGQQGRNSSSLQVGEQMFTVVGVAVTTALFTAGGMFLLPFAVAALLGLIGVLMGKRSYA
ncbi:MFS transporter [Flindersiella endophytica]